MTVAGVALVTAFTFTLSLMDTKMQTFMNKHSHGIWMKYTQLIGDSLPVKDRTSTYSSVTVTVCKQFLSKMDNLTLVLSIFKHFSMIQVV